MHVYAALWLWWRPPPVPLLPQLSHDLCGPALKPLMTLLFHLALSGPALTAYRHCTAVSPVAFSPPVLHPLPRSLRVLRWARDHRPYLSDPIATACSSPVAPFWAHFNRSVCKCAWPSTNCIILRPA